MDIKKELEELTRLQRKESSTNFQRMFDKMDSVGSGQDVLCQRVDSLKEKVDSIHKTMHGNGNPKGGCVANQMALSTKTAWLWRIVVGTMGVFVIVGIVAAIKYPAILLEVIK